MRRKIWIVTVLVLFGPAAAISRAEPPGGLTRLEIARVESPTFEGRTFGGVGQYEKLVGRFQAEIDPTNPRNAVITDLDKAPRNARGNVEYSADFYILKPKDMTKGNGVLLYEFGNRGNKGLLSTYNNSAGGTDPTTAEDAGSGFLLDHGYTLVWSGILADVPSAGGRLTIQVPIARNTDGSPIEETVWDECGFPNSEGTERCTLAYPVPRLDQREGRLLVRTRRRDPPREIPTDGWAFDGPAAIKLLPAGTTFEPGLIYQFIHRAADPPVMGIGLASARDLVSFLRYGRRDQAGTANPLMGIRRALSVGSSQTGRFEREFVYLGFNEEVSSPGRRIFDGMNIHVSGTRPFVNYRFAQPNRRADLQHNDLYYPTSAFPFAYEDQVDPFSKRTDGILHRCAATGTCPKITHTTSSLEYWQFKNSTVITDPLGTRDAAVPDNVRVYLYAGAQHGPNRASNPPGVCEQPPNLLDYRPLSRALLVALAEWVVSNVAPPPSRHPRIADRTLVAVENVAWPAIPGVTFAGPAVNRHQIYDYGPQFAQGIIGEIPPRPTGNEYQVLVPQVDTDGNDIAGIRMPTLSVPVATRTGWSVWARSSPAAGEFCNQDGSLIPFPRTRAERLATKDPRLSIEERYPTHDVYVRKIRDAATRLVQERYLLQEDATRLGEQAIQSDTGGTQP